MEEIVERGLTPRSMTPFPVEIWKKVLGKCEDSRDIHNVLTVYPLLEGIVLNNKKYEWTLDQVLPHIRPLLTNDDILSCRRVCRRWFQAVDNYLENHPSRRAFDHVSQSIVTDPFHYQKLWDNDDVYLKLTKRFSSFHQNMKWVPPTRNPFLGRLTEVDYGDGATKDEVRKRIPAEPWTREFESLRKFGSQIWFLRIYSNRPENFLFAQRFIGSLDLLPNLKSLDFDIDNNSLPLVVLDRGHVETDIYSRQPKESLPALPQLESLGFCNLTPTPLVNMMVLKYSGQVRRLEIHFHAWRKEYSNLFPKLTELFVRGLRTHLESVQILQSLQAPDLFRLELEVGYHSKDLGNWILSLLGNRFKRLGSLCIALASEPPGLIEGEGQPLPVTPISSVKFLQLQGFVPDGVDFEFLASLPSLEHIKIQSRCHLPYFEKTGMYELGLWRMLPKLKGISVNHFHCYKTRFDWLRNLKVHGGNPGVNDLIISLIADCYTDGVPGNLRLVNRQWHRSTLVEWRTHSTVTLYPQNLLPDMNPEKYYIQYLDNEDNCCHNIPFKKYCLQGGFQFGHGGRFGQSPIDTLFERVGQHVQELTVQDCSFTTVASFRALVFSSCLRLKSLSLIHCTHAGWRTARPDEGSDFVEPLVGIWRKLTHLRLSFGRKNCQLPISFTEMFSTFNNLKTLKILESPRGQEIATMTAVLKALKTVKDKDKSYMPLTTLVFDGNALVPQTMKNEITQLGLPSIDPRQNNL